MHVLLWIVQHKRHKHKSESESHKEIDASETQIDTPHPLHYPTIKKTATVTGKTYLYYYDDSREQAITAVRYSSHNERFTNEYSELYLNQTEGPWAKYGPYLFFVCFLRYLVNVAPQIIFLIWFSPNENSCSHR